MKSNTRLRTDLVWNKVLIDGALVGHYAPDGRLMIVRHRTGWEKTTQRSGSGPAGDEALARVMLSEQGPALTVVRTAG